MVTYGLEAINCSVFNLVLYVNFGATAQTAIIITGWCFRYVANCAYFIAHWAFAWKYFLVSQLMVHLKLPTSYNMKFHKIVNFTMIGVIIVNEAISDFGRAKANL